MGVFSDSSGESEAVMSLASGTIASLSLQLRKSHTWLQLNIIGGRHPDAVVLLFF